MIKNSFFRKYALIAVVLTILFVGLSVLSVGLFLRFAKHDFENSPPAFFAHLLGDRPAGERAAELRRLAAAGQRVPHPDTFWLLDASGAVVAAETDRPLPHPWSEYPRPARDYEFAPMLQVERHGPPSGVVLLPGSPTQYLVVDVDFDRMHGPNGLPPGPPNVFIATLISIVTAALLAMLGTLVLLFHSLRQKAQLADTVISELQHGNLKARFPVTGFDEIGQSMAKFNLMAEEIERLVENMKRIESARTTMLQELTHDLRTPVASLKSLLETLSLRGDELPAEKRAQFLAFSVREAEYFERLLEDLLFLAQASDPHYRRSFAAILLEPVVLDESGAVATHYPGKTTLFEPSAAARGLRVAGDEQLLRRLVRNTLENAYSFARKRVIVDLTSTATEVQLRIEDDGPGFSPEALQAFGERRKTRVLGEGEAFGGRISVGLGSVIMRSVGQLLHGSVTAENRIGPDGRVSGARILICLPLDESK